VWGGLISTFWDSLSVPSLRIKLSKKKETDLSLKMGTIGSPKTSVSNHFTSRNNPEDGRIQFKSGGSLTCWSWIIKLFGIVFRVCVRSYRFLCHSLVVPSCAKLYSVVLSCTQLYPVVPRCTQLYPVVLSCTQFYSVVLSRTQSYSVVPSCTQSYSVVPSCTQLPL
jgi:hypothetical protein